MLTSDPGAEEKERGRVEWGEDVESWKMEQGQQEVLQREKDIGVQRRGVSIDPVACSP